MKLTSDLLKHIDSSLAFSLSLFLGGIRDILLKMSSFFYASTVAKQASPCQMYMKERHIQSTERYESSMNRSNNGCVLCMYAYIYT